MIATAQTTLAPDPVVVLLAHMACADHQLHHGELEAIRRVSERAAASPETYAACEEVFSGRIDRDGRRATALAVPAGRRMMALEMLIAVAYADGVCLDSEREMLEEVGRLWGYSKDRLDALCESARAADERASVAEDDDRTASLGARFLSITDRMFSPQLVDRIASISESARERVERLRREFLLAGPEYREAVTKCARIASEDYAIAQDGLHSTRTELEQVAPALDTAIAAVTERAGRRTANTAQALKVQFESTREELVREAGTRLAEVARSTAARQRALKSFSVAFMGRTKAGKSTLHAVVTGQGWEGIGVGAQRTTRMNRVYEWCHIRIIDTPGIGAPGGLADEEIAAQVIPEADVVCYVVTNDSQQETEFRFLKVLKEQAKPLLILLNIKENLRDPERLRRFLRSPDRPFRSDGPSGLGGHLERIRRYAREHYANDYFSIVPVHLLAAQMSRENAHGDVSSDLMRASRLPDFLEGIRASLLEMGPLRRSQTLLAGTVVELRRTHDWLREQHETFRGSSGTIQRRTQALLPTLESAKRDVLYRLEAEIRTVYVDLRLQVDAFAEDHWEDRAESLNAAWNDALVRLDVERRLAVAHDDAVARYGDLIREALDELGRDLELNARLGVGFGRLDAQDSKTFWKGVFRWGGHVIALAGTGLGLFAVVAAPIAAGIAVLGGLLALASKLFEGRDKKRGRAVAKLSSSLHAEITQQEKRSLDTARTAFETHAGLIAVEIRSYFAAMVGGLDAIAAVLAQARGNLSGQICRIERAYAKRVLDWVSGTEEPLSSAVIARDVDTATFEPGRLMSICARSPVRLRRTLPQLRAALQHDVKIEPLV